MRVLSQTHPLALSSLSIEPFSAREIGLFRSESRRSAGFDALARRAMRFRFLSALGSPTLDREARAGVIAAEAATLLHLARLRSADALEWTFKADLFGSAGEVDFGANLVSMLKAALASDATLVGLG